MTTTVTGEGLREAWGFFSEPEYEKDLKPDSHCHFCETHVEGQDLTVVKKWKTTRYWEIEPETITYFNIKYCPLCGKKLEAPTWVTQDQGEF